MRMCESTTDDIELLNKNFVISAWAKEPILAGRNSVIDAFNINAINDNGAKVGYFLIYNFPLVPMSRGL